ncbi:hypothetical protein LJR230_002009 [Trinickia sp. LjRoot230]|uniref:hypothetical protein n=1 Tax=Trinickia sp. LjRoot230 TaxID=3342288 RepID=UPI003ED14FE8
MEPLTPDCNDVNSKVVLKWPEEIRQVSLINLSLEVIGGRWESNPARLEKLMDQLLNRREEWAAERRLHATEKERRATEAEAKPARLYEAIEIGSVDMGDALLNTRIAELTTIRDQARGDAERAVTHVERIGPEITPQTLGTFARAVRRKLRHEDGTYARNQIRAVEQRVEVVSKTNVCIRSSRTELLRTLTATSGVKRRC